MNVVFCSGMGVQFLFVVKSMLTYVAHHSFFLAAFNSLMSSQVVFDGVTFTAGGANVT